jgi:hypothetical protein
VLLREADSSLCIHEFKRVAVNYNLGPILRLMSPVTRSDFVSDLFGDDISAV